MNEKPQGGITRPLDKVVRRSFTIHSCSHCDCAIGTHDASIMMKHGAFCIPCAETFGAFDRFKSDD